MNNLKSSNKSASSWVGSNKKSKGGEHRLIGTPDYIAPEIINKTSIDNLTIDWWSFGVMCYQILIGVRPFCGDSVEEVLENTLQMKI